jgi:polyphenol oxidase
LNLEPDPVLRLKSLDSDRLVHGIAVRHGGVSPPPWESLNLSVKTGDEAERVLENRRRFERMMAVESRQVAFGRLSHGNKVISFQLGGLMPTVSPPNLGWPMFDGDAAVSNVPGLMLVMTFADCVPILLWDEENCACGLVHAGWRGTALRIGSMAVRAMTAAFGTDPAKLRAAIGPCIGACCYTVGSEVQRAMDAAYPEESHTFFDDDRLDLNHANSADLFSARVGPENLNDSDICTSCHTDRYFSHRREHGNTGRFGACIGVVAPGRFADSAPAERASRQSFER